MATAGSEAATDQKSSSGAAEKSSSAPRNTLLAGFNRLDIMRQLGLMLGLAASIALGFAVVLWSQSEEYQPLYANMQGYEISELVEVLESERISFRIDPASGVLLVPSKRVADLRLRVAGAGIMRDTGFGYEYLDRDQGLGTSQFMESNRYKRSLEGELQRTITGFRNVHSARVHLATPERSVFVRNSRKPTASVFLTLQSGRQLGDTQVQAIANLVASSVPEMAPEDVTIVDQQGNLLSTRQENRELLIAGEQFEYVRRYEETLVNRVNRILQPVVGAGRFTAEVAADIDFTRTEQAAEQFNPGSTVLRSEQSLDERRTGNEIIAGIPGALTNQPPAPAQVPETLEQVNDQQAALSGNSRQQATRNYEVDRTISYTNFDPVSVRRLTVAVVIDDHASELSPDQQPWTQDDLDRVSALVRDAIGFSSERGDSVTVINRRFATVDFAAFDDPPFWQEPWVLSAVKQAAGALFLLVLVFGVLLPVLKSLSTAGKDNRTLAPTNNDQDFADLDIEGMGIADDSVTLSGGTDVLLPGPNDGYERQLNAIKGLVADDPARVAQVVKQWITNDG